MLSVINIFARYKFFVKKQLLIDFVERVVELGMVSLLLLTLIA
jgi:hypothetical protein